MGWAYAGLEVMQQISSLVLIASLVLCTFIGYICYETFDSFWTDRRRKERNRKWQTRLAKLRETRPHFRYKPLGDPTAKEIRLIELYPSNHLDFSIRVISLLGKDIEEYEALSYCWGDVIDSYPIRGLDGSILWISNSLHRALLQLRPKSGVRLLWADAICINQRDAAEKSWQVKQMGLVYQSARRVLVYLGEDEDDSEDLQDFIPRIVSASKRSKAARNPILDIFQLSRTEKKEFGVPDPLWDLLSINALMTLRQRKWFQRVWIIQELLLAKEAIFICGRWECSWLDFLVAVDFTMGTGLLAYSTLQPINISHYEVLQTSRNHWINSPYTWNLRELLERHSRSYATNPVDHIFALVGLAKDGEAIDVDYSKPVADVFFSATKHILLNSKDLGHLNFSGLANHASKVSLPSWVPDWSSETETFPLTMYLSDGFNVKYDRYKKNASSGTESQHVLSLDAKELSLSGYKIGSVASTGPCAPAAKPSTTCTNAVTHDLLCAVSDWAQLVSIDSETTYDLTGEPLSWAFLKALEADLQDESYRRPQDPAILSVQNMIQNMQWTKMLVQPLFGWPAPHYITMAVFMLLRLPFTLYYLLFHRRLIGDLGDYLRTIQKSYGRQLFMTTEGYIGLAPKDTRLGDEVWLLKGGPTPYILRIVDTDMDKYALLGECSVYGIMKGEAWDDAKCHIIKLV